MFYKIAIIVLVVFALGHMGYALLAFAELSEPALWFFSGALGPLFAAFLNYLNFSVADKQIYQITLAANCMLLLFLTVLAITVAESQTVGVAVTSILVTVAGLVRRPA